MVSRVLTLKHSGSSPILALQEAALEIPNGAQVRVRITSAGLNRADLLFQQESYFEKPSPNCRIGFEGAGIVEAVGPLASYRVGDRVALCPMLIKASTQGCLADHAIFDSAQLIDSPASLSDAHTGAVWMSYLTAWGGMIDAGALRANETVLISAASSSVGIASIQVALAHGANIVATTTSASKAALLKEQGAHHVLVQPRDEDGFDDFSEQLHRCAPEGIDLSFDAVAGPVSRVLVKNAKRGGRIVIHGLLDRRPMNVHAGVLMKRLLTLRGYTLDASLTQPTIKATAIDAVRAGLESGVYSPLIAATYSLANYQEAFDALESNQHVGKIVLCP